MKSELPNPKGKLVCITLYAEKTQLSLFGTTQAYPIMAQLVQLPQEIHNGKGLGATQVFGWIPIISLPFVSILPLKYLQKIIG